jgi:hypothetical protein
VGAGGRREREEQTGPLSFLTEDENAKFGQGAAPTSNRVIPPTQRGWGGQGPLKYGHRKRTHVGLDGDGARGRIGTTPLCC